MTAILSGFSAVPSADMTSPYPREFLGKGHNDSAYPARCAPAGGWSETPGARVVGLGSPDLLDHRVGPRRERLGLLPDGHEAVEAERAGLPAQVVEPQEVPGRPAEQHRVRLDAALGALAVF